VTGDRSVFSAASDVVRAARAVSQRVEAFRTAARAAWRRGVRFTYHRGAL